jgi:hypothetical protein
MGVERLLAEGREVAFISSPTVSPTSGPAGIPSASLARHPLVGLLTFRQVGEGVVVVVVPADPARLFCGRRASIAFFAGLPSVAVYKRDMGHSIWMVPTAVDQTSIRPTHGTVKNLDRFGWDLAQLDVLKDEFQDFANHCRNGILAAVPPSEYLGTIRIS